MAMCLTHVSLELPQLRRAHSLNGTKRKVLYQSTVIHSESLRLIFKMRNRSKLEVCEVSISVCISCWCTEAAEENRGCGQSFCILQNPCANNFVILISF